MTPWQSVSGGSSTYIIGEVMVNSQWSLLIWNPAKRLGGESMAKHGSFPDAVSSTEYRFYTKYQTARIRLYHIRLLGTDECPQCHTAHRMIHRNVTCAKTAEIWTWTNEWLVFVLRTVPRRIPTTRITAPGFSFWPTQKHHAVLRILSKMIQFCD